MSRIDRGWIGAASVLAVVVSPLWAELWYEHRPDVVAAAAALIGGALLVLAQRPRALVGGSALAAVAGVLAPAAAWPLALLPLARRDLERRRWSMAAGPALAVLVGAALHWGDVDQVSFGENPVAKASEAVNAVLLAATNAVWPAVAPFAGPSRYPQGWGAPLLGGVASLVFAGGVVFGVRSLRGRTLVAGAAALLACVGPALVGRPVNGAALGLVPVCVGAAGALFVLLRSGLRTRAGRGLALLGGAAVFAGYLTTAWPRACEHWSAYADLRTLWAVRLAEPSGPAYRGEYAAALRRAGDADAGQRQEALYFRGADAGPAARAAYLGRLLRAGDDAAVAAQWRLLPHAARPTEEAPVRAVLAWLLRTDDEAGYFAYGAEAAEACPALHVTLAQTAQARGLSAPFQRHLAAALAADPPSLAALELGYRDARDRQDCDALARLGARATARHPDAWVGPAAYAKAAKFVRDDAELIRRGEAALRLNPDLADLHYDLALVYHGRADDRLLAAAHYRRVLALVPEHPRRATLTEWIAALDPPEGAGR